MSTRDKSGLGSSDAENSPVYDRFAKFEGMHVVPPPMIGNYMPPKSNFGLDELNFTYGPKQSKTSESDAKTSDFDSCETNSSVETIESVPEPVVVEPKVVSQLKALHVKTPRETVKEQNICSPSPKVNKRDWNGSMSKRLGLGYGFTKKACFVCDSFSHLIRDYDFHEKRMAKQVELNKQKGKGTGQGENKPVWNNVQRLNHQNKFVPKAVLTKTSIFSVNTARQNPFSQAAETSTTRKVNTARPIKERKKISDDTEVLLEEEETAELVEEPTELVEDQGSGEKGEQEVTTDDTALNTSSVPISTTSATPKVSTTAANLVYIRRSSENAGTDLDEEERKRIARDAEIAKQLQEEYDKAGKKEVVAEVDTAHVIDWNDPSIISLVQERYNSSGFTKDKEIELWVELKMLFEPDAENLLELQKYMHDPLKWWLYDMCVVHHVSTEKGQNIFMLVEKDYPLTNGLATLMLCNKLRVDQQSEMVNTGRTKLSTARPKLSTDSTKIESMKLEAMVEERRIFKCWFHYHTTNGHQFTMSNRHQELASPEQTASELASPKQTALGKDISNPLIVDSLLKTIWLSMHHVIAMKHWLFQSKRLLEKIGFMKIDLDDKTDVLTYHKKLLAEALKEKTNQKHVYESFHIKGIALLVHLESYVILLIGNYSLELPHVDGRDTCCDQKGWIKRNESKNIKRNLKGRFLALECGA
ncbi:hypothetical protein Tco_0894125 [Tanacetum coccineum]|uniref:Uncharacterized protein n=1 Tax=Tanacetum coccineum TaxID=301880 RepID=A0ABQ5CC49_9ASTR